MLILYCVPLMAIAAVLFERRHDAKRERADRTRDDC
jgi:hypothetical protein